jgi:hypothetical protein
MTGESTSPILSSDWRSPKARKCGSGASVRRREGTGDTTPLRADSEHSVTRLQRLNLTDSQQRDAITYEPGQIVEFHRMAKGVVRSGVQEKRITGPKVLDFYSRFCAHRATCLKADGKDIKVLNLILSGDFGSV